MNNFQVRFAQNGYPQKYQNITSIQVLQQQILRDYKIDISNQRLLSKKGTIVGAGESPEFELKMKKTFVGDGSFKEKTSEYYPIYLFNHKQLIKSEVNSIAEDNLDQQSKSIIRKKHETCAGLRTKVYELQHFSKKFTQDELLKISLINPALPEIATEWFKTTDEFMNSMFLFKENQYCIEEYIERWQNQRKGLLTLIKNLELACSDKKAKLEKLVEKLDDFIGLYAAQARSEAENCPANMIEQKESTRKQLQETHEHLRKRLANCNKYLGERIVGGLKQFKRTVKQYHHQLEKQFKELDSKKRRQSRDLQKISTQMKSNYVILLDAIRDRLDRNSDEKLKPILERRFVFESRYSQYNRNVCEVVTESEQIFAKVFKYNKQHEKIVKSSYKKYHQIHVDVQQNFQKSLVKAENEIYSLYQSLTNYNQKLRQSLKQSQYSQSNLSSNLNIKLVQEMEEAEIKRRMQFNARLLAIQQQIKSILKQEEKERRSFLAEIINIREMYENTLLSNVRVPCVMVNFDETTDQELPVEGGGYKGGERGLEVDARLEFYKGAAGMDRVLQQLEIIKNCQVTLRRQQQGSPTQHKIRNLQTLLQKSAQIFHHIYTQKLSLTVKQHQCSLNSLHGSLKSLEQENKSLREQILSLTQSKFVEQEQRKEVHGQVLRLEGVCRGLEAEREVLQNKLRGSMDNVDKITNEMRMQAEQWGREVEKIRGQKQEIEERFSKEVQNMQILLYELQKYANQKKNLQQLNQQYKQVMGDQQIRIVTLQSQLKIVHSEGIPKSEPNISLQQSFYGANLPAIVEPTVRKISSPRNDSKKQQQVKQQTNQINAIQIQISKLEKQLQELREQNQALRADNQNLNTQIQKMALDIPETSDYETQTQHSNNAQQPENSQAQTQRLNGVNQIVTQYLPSPNQSLKLDLDPQPGQLRLFMPFSSGLYIAVRTSPTLNSPSFLSTLQPLPSEQPYILDMNCLPNKARELLTQCTLIVVVRVTRVLPGSGRYYVEGLIEQAIGFEDDDLQTRDYGPMIRG